ncbi:prepilin-type N-terminal cleavage/methylation domain-containing protein [Dactylosporangium sp. NBC_01737]|uniref:prepilin-type N-terminal cleavage/methylation domain-containing protein n=1 Tax=Dactylosporangium sp. NBC_01737 TaxID=2975959 RepID=UPI002E14AD16|nr:prepilin-type N-terminal cleavage/methylation domain-containing protein [Dactylosporangium sp. NBC_01737]
MKETLRRMQKKRAAGDGGFTLVELLVVVVIIGVLVAIAVPMYLNYRKGAANKSAESDVRAAVSAAEQFYTENGNKYPADVKSVNAGDKLTFKFATGTSIEQVATVSPNNRLSFTNLGDGAYRICGVNEDGETVYVYSSLEGGSVKKAASADLDTCATNG